MVLPLKVFFFDIFLSLSPTEIKSLEIAELRTEGREREMESAKEEGLVESINPERGREKRERGEGEVRGD